jgi:hypothetical protein
MLFIPFTTQIREQDDTDLLIGLMDGYPTFVISILFIGLNTAVIGDVAGHLGCFISLKDSVNAIAFVALGTSIPGTSALAWID